MTRPCLAERLRHLLPEAARDATPTGFVEGKSSLLRTLVESGQITASALQLFLSEETGHATPRTACRCGGTGYRGRRGIYEFLTATREVKRMLLAGQLGEGVEIPGFRRMVDYGRDAVIGGITSVEEVCRVVRVQEVL